MQLADNEVHLWFADLERIDRALIPRYRALMSAGERQRNERYRFEHLREADCVTRALVRTVLSRYVPLAPDEWRFSPGEHGKPEIDQPGLELPLRFNLSHTSRYVVCAVGLERDLGVDIERTQRRNSVLNIANRYFSEQEVDELFRLPATQQEDRFFDYWTLKEAYMKASGEGIALGLGNFGFCLTGRDRIRVRFSDSLSDNPEHWWFWLHRLSPDHRLALAVRTGSRPPALRLFRTTPLASADSELPC